jgi:hypothetical protein
MLTFVTYLRFALDVELQMNLRCTLEPRRMPLGAEITTASRYWLFGGPPMSFRRSVSVKKGRVNPRKK